MLRTIRKGLYKSNNVRFLALLIAVAFVLLTEMACVGNMTAKAETAGDVAASVYADTEAPGVATPTSVVEKTALKMNSSTYVFTNSPPMACSDSALRRARVTSLVQVRTVIHLSHMH